MKHDCIGGKSAGWNGLSVLGYCRSNHCFPVEMLLITLCDKKKVTSFIMNFVNCSVYSCVALTTTPGGPIELVPLNERLNQ